MGPPGNNEIEDAAETVFDSATDAGLTEGFPFDRA